MPAPSLFSVAVVGLLAGVAARWIVGRRQSTFASLAAGVLGALLGVAVAGWLELPIDGLAPLAVAAFAGAAALLSVATLVLRR